MEILHSIPFRSSLPQWCTTYLVQFTQDVKCPKKCIEWKMNRVHYLLINLFTIFTKNVSFVALFMSTLLFSIFFFRFIRNISYTAVESVVNINIRHIDNILFVNVNSQSVNQMNFSVYSIQFFLLVIMSVRKKNLPKLQTTKKKFIKVKKNRLLQDLIQVNQ